MGKRKNHVKISFTITNGKAPHHSSNQQNRAHLAREQQRAEARRIEQERAEAKRIAEEEKAKRKAAEEKARYSMHEKALALYPDFENGTLNKLTPLNEQQSHTPPQRREDGATLPYLLLMSDNINDFLQLVQKMGYKIHLPHLGEHNLLKQLSKRSDAIAILEKINPLSSEEYEFLANEALAQFDLANSPCDDILIWLLRKNQLPQKIINTLNQRTATAIHDHFELYRHLFSKNGMFIKQATAVRTLFLTQLLARRAHLPEEIDQTLTTCYVEEYAYNNNKKIHVDLLFSDLMSTSQKTAADTFEHIKKICQKNASWHITLSEEFWQLLLLNHEPAFVQQFAELVKDRLDINNKNRLIKKTLRTMRTPQESAIILEPWLSKEIVNHENYANLVDIAVKTHTTHFEFARTVLSLSDNIIEPQTSRLSLLRTLFQASTPNPRTLQSWYYKKKCYDIETLLDDLTAVQQRPYALSLIKKIVDVEHKSLRTAFKPYSETFISSLINEQEINCIVILYPTFSHANQNTLRHLMLQALTNGTPDVTSLVDLHINNNQAVFDSNTSKPVRLRVLKRLFDTHQDNPEKIIQYIKKLYQGKQFYLTTLYADLTAIKQESWIISIVADLIEHQNGSMTFNLELFNIIAPIPEFVDKLAHLSDKTAIRSLCEIAPSIENKIHFIYRYQSAFIAEDFYQLFNNYITVENIEDQYHTIKGCLQQQQAHPTHPLIIPPSYEESTGQEKAVEAMPVSAYSSMPSHCVYVKAVLIEEEQSFHTLKKEDDIDDTEKKEPYLDTATSSSSQIPAESETLTPISQKILLAFAKISFEKIMCADRAMQLAKELQHTWLQLHFLESYIEIMFEWAKISIIHHEIGPDVNPHHLKIKQFMSEPAIPAQNTLQTIRSSLSILSLFAPPEATMYQSLTDGKKANKIKNTNEIAEQYRKIEEKFQPIFQA